MGYTVKTVDGELKEYAFDIGGVLALRNFKATTNGNRLIIQSHEKANFTILDALVNEVEIDGVVYDDVVSAQEALQRLVFNPAIPTIITRELREKIKSALQPNPNGSVTRFFNEKGELVELRNIELSDILTSDSEDVAFNLKGAKVLDGKKVDKVAGKDLSSNDFTDALKSKLTSLKNTELSNSLTSDSEETGLTSKGAKALKTLIDNISFLDQNNPPYLLDTADADTIPDTMRFTFKGGNTVDVNMKVLFDLGVLKQVATGNDYTLNFTSLGGTAIPVSLKSWFDEKISKNAKGSIYKLISETGLAYAIPRAVIGSHENVTSADLNRLYPFLTHPTGSIYFHLKDKRPWIRISNAMWERLNYTKLNEIITPLRNLVPNASLKRDITNQTRLELPMIENARKYLESSETYRIYSEIEIDNYQSGEVQISIDGFAGYYIAPKFSSGINIYEIKYDRISDFRNVENRLLIYNNIIADKVTIKNIFCGVGNVKAQYLPAIEDIEEKSKLYLADKNGIVKKEVADKKLLLGDGVKLNSATGIIEIDENYLATKFKAISQGYKFKDLSSEIMRQDYQYSVIALCELTNSNTSLNSWCSGNIVARRDNGGSVGISMSFLVEKVYNSSNVSGFLHKSKDLSDTKICTFTYNGKKYAGIHFFNNNSAYNTIYMNWQGTFEPFALDYKNTRDTLTVLNQEINNSLAFPTNNIRQGTLQLA